MKMFSLSDNLKYILCPMCESIIGEFKDKKSLKEFEISGMCQSCQDRIFGEPKWLQYPKVT